jgi:hypothetical protein
MWLDFACMLSVDLVLFDLVCSDLWLLTINLCPNGHHASKYSPISTHTGLLVVLDERNGFFLTLSILTYTQDSVIRLFCFELT